MSVRRDAAGGLHSGRSICTHKAGSQFSRKSTFFTLRHFAAASGRRSRDSENVSHRRRHQGSSVYRHDGEATTIAISGAFTWYAYRPFQKRANREAFIACKPHSVDTRTIVGM